MIFFAVGLIVQLAAAVTLAVSVNLDCEIRNIKSKSLYTDLSFFFGLFGFLAYYIARDKAKQKEQPELTSKEMVYVEYSNLKKYKKSQILFYVSLLLFVIQMLISIHSIMTDYSLTNFIEDIFKFFVK